MLQAYLASVRIRSWSYSTRGGDQYWLYVGAVSMLLASSWNVCSITKWSEIKWRLVEHEAGAATQRDSHSNRAIRDIVLFLSNYSVSFGVHLASKRTNSGFIPFGEVLCFGRWQNFLRSGLRLLGCEACLAVMPGKWSDVISEACCTGMQYLGDWNHEPSVACPDIAEGSIKHNSLAFSPVLKQQDFSWRSCLAIWWMSVKELYRH